MWWVENCFPCRTELGFHTFLLNDNWDMRKLAFVIIKRDCSSAIASDNTKKRKTPEERMTRVKFSF